jgi:DNA-binding transcriptional LysR family regulator
VVDLENLSVFIGVVEAGSFTAAAKRLGVPTSTVSRRIARLEEQLGARLLQRTTRKLSLTDAGRIYFERGQRVVADAQEAERAVAETQAEPSGLLRVTAPPDLSGRLWAVIRPYLTAHPKVRIELTCTPRFVDLIEEGYDLALRGGPAPEAATLVVRKLAELPRIMVASPDYLARAGTPRVPADLVAHQCVLFRAWSLNSHWTLKCSGQDKPVPVDGRLLLDDLDAVRWAARDGFGIAQHFAEHCREDLASGALREVLPGSCLPAGALWLVYPSRHHLRPAVRAFIDMTAERLPAVCGSTAV